MVDGVFYFISYKFSFKDKKNTSCHHVIAIRKCEINGNFVFVWFSFVPESK